METKRRLHFTRGYAAKGILFLLVFLWPVLTSSQQKYERTEVGVPEELQVPIFLKILTYDRSLQARVKDTIHIGVLYFPEDDRSKKNKDAFIKNLKLNKDKTVNGIPFSFTEIKFGTKERLDELIGKKGINILYVTSDGSNMIKGISGITQEKKILTMTGRVDYVNRGISLSLGVEEEKPQIVINLRSARAEGCDFSANLLRLCKVIN